MLFIMEWILKRLNRPVDIEQELKRLRKEQEKRD